jgi:hypothetical protein
MEGRRPRPTPFVTTRLEPPCRPITRHQSRLVCGGEGMGAPSAPAQLPAPTWNLPDARAPATPSFASARRRPRRALLEPPELPPAAGRPRPHAAVHCPPARAPGLRHRPSSRTRSWFAVGAGVLPFVSVGTSEEEDQASEG